MVTTQFSVTVLKNGVHRRHRGANMAGVFSRWWAAQHGRQYSILQRFLERFWSCFLQVSLSCCSSKNPLRGENTPEQRLVLVAAATGLIFVTPEFLVFKGHVSTLDELLRDSKHGGIEATTLRRRSFCCSAWCRLRGALECVSQERGLRR